ncbi:MAG: sensor histidine kinase [Cellulophaga sp.]
MNEAIAQLLNNIFKRRWLSHLIFWLLLLFFYTNIKTAYNHSYYSILIHNSLMLIPQILASYFSIYVLIPKLLYKKKYVLFFISFILASYLFSVLARIMIVHIVEELYREPPFTQESIYTIFTDIGWIYKHYFYSVYLPVFLVISIKLIKELFEEKSKHEVLEKEKASAELNFFKAQIHPHFLFNTLNNLYVLTLQKSDKASETVLKLSEMLDYMLYQCNDDSVTIQKEIQLIQNYIDLEQLRYGDRLKLTFNKNIDNLQTKIAPLILVSLIENAFKHGASGAINQPIIEIDIRIEKEKLQFSIYNTKPEEKQQDLTNFKKGIGVVNTKKQLQLLYPNKHKIETKEDELSYRVTLSIDLKGYITEELNPLVE